MFSATDIANFLACQHTARLALAESQNEIKRPIFYDPSLKLLQTLGLEHEKQYLDYLSNKGIAVTHIKSDDVLWSEAASQTIDAIRRGDPAIYQAALSNGGWRGRADFLVRVESPSALGAWSYEALDTKLARSTKAGAVLQLCFYSDLLSCIQGVEPKLMHVVLGGKAGSKEFDVQRYIAYYRRIRDEYETYFKTNPKTYPEPTEHCDVCSWAVHCDKQRHDDDHLSLIAGISRNQRKILNAREVTTMAGFANLTIPVVPPIERIGKATLERIYKQAKLQIKGREQNNVFYELLTPNNPGEGLAGLPAPSKGDIFLDLEANPFIFDDGLEFLIGFLRLTENADPIYEAYWSSTPAQEKASFEKFIATVMRRRDVFPDMHIYHYAAYEQTALKRLAGRHATCAEELDELLRGKVFVDLFRIFRQGIRASVESYSIKKLEPLYQFQRKVPLSEANRALASYEAALTLGSNTDLSELFKTIEGYNRDDCFSAWELRKWLEQRRPEWEKINNQALSRPELQSGEPGLDLAAQLDVVADLKRRLTEKLPEDNTQWNDNQHACWLLAQMIEWHRRENKSMWWEYFRLLDLSDEELQEDKNAMGGLEYIGPCGQEKKSIIHRYSFPPQDHAIKARKDVRDPRTEKSPGEIWAVDDLNRTVDIKRGATSSAPHPTSLILHEYVPAKMLEESLRALASWVADNAIDACGENQAARSLLLRRPPSIQKDIGLPVGEDGHLTGPSKLLLRSLVAESGVLPIQGPPGSGKTFTGAQMIVELVKQGRRVGVSAVSHKVIVGLLQRTCETAEENNISLRVIQKIKSEEEACSHSFVTPSKKESFRDSLLDGRFQVAAGTAWLWCRPDMAKSVDVLFIDEAGQMSLANTLAIAQATTSVVLLGDPQQLDQPQRGVHPPGAEVSALGHLLNNRKTITEDQGIFLAQTHRLHPNICSFTSEIFYDSRLIARSENSNQKLNIDGALGGTGLRFAPVEHYGNQSESLEEVEMTNVLTRNLLKSGNTWTDKRGIVQPLTIKDILVVAPYNAQVDALAASLPVGARVGTVDKFQGQQAPIVIYSMATSTPEDAPRGMEFLYSMNRLNVATSRAQCVTVIVASPSLFRVQCKTPRQIELANSFARYLELAEVVGSPCN